MNLSIKSKKGVNVLDYSKRNSVKKERITSKNKEFTFFNEEFFAGKSKRTTAINKSRICKGFFFACPLFVAALKKKDSQQ